MAIDFTGVNFGQEKDDEIDFTGVDFSGVDFGEPNEGSVGMDLAASFGKGSNLLLKSIGDVYGLASGNMDNWASRQGQSGVEYYEDLQSDELRRLQQDRTEAVGQADGFWDEAGTAVWETVKNPRLFATFLTEQIPMTIGPGAAGRVASGVSKAAGVGAAVGTGAALQGGSVGDEVYDNIVNMPEEVWQKNDDYQALLSEMAPEEAKESLALKYARGAATASGALSVGSQMVPGGIAIERVLSKGKGALPGGLLARVGKGFAGETAQEALEEGGGQFVGNIGERGIDPTQDLMEGVGESAGLGALGGGPFGALAGLPGGDRQQTLDNIEQEVTEKTGNPVDGAIARAEADLELNTIDIDSYIADELVQADRDTSVDIGPVTVERPGSDDQYANDAPTDQSPIQNDFLSPYTEADLQARAEQEAQQEAAQQEVNVAEADDFRLTGSDRPADIATAGGQQDLLGSVPKQVSEDEAPAAADTQTQLIDTTTTQPSAESTQEAEEAATETEDFSPVLRANGTPFKTEKSALASAKQKKVPNAKPVQVDGGWGYVAATTQATDQPAQTVEKPTQTTDKLAQTADQPIIDRIRENAKSTSMRFGDKSVSPAIQDYVEQTIATRRKLTGDEMQAIADRHELPRNVVDQFESNGGYGWGMIEHLAQNGDKSAQAFRENKPAQSSTNQETIANENRQLAEQAQEVEAAGQETTSILSETPAKAKARIARERGLKKGSPGYKAAVDEAYNAEYERTLANLPFEEYQKQEPDQPEEVQRQTWEALREDYGITETPNVPAGRPGRDTNLAPQQPDDQTGSAGVVGRDDGVRAGDSDTGAADAGDVVGDPADLGATDADAALGRPYRSPEDRDAAIDRLRREAPDWAYQSIKDAAEYGASEAEISASLDSISEDDGQALDELVDAKASANNGLKQGFGEVSAVDQPYRSAAASKHPLDADRYGALQALSASELRRVAKAAGATVGRNLSQTAIIDRIDAQPVSDVRRAYDEVTLAPTEAAADGAQGAGLSDSSSSKTVGEIGSELSAKIKRQSAPIVLENGNDQYGRQHIEVRRGDLLRDNGYTVDQFVEEIASGFNQVYRAGGGQLVLAKVNGKDKIAFIKLSPSDDGDYYRVNSALIVEKRHIKKHVRDNNYEMLWDGVEPPPETSSESPAFAHPPESKLDQEGPNVPGHSDKNVAPIEAESQPTLSKSGKPFKGRGSATLAAKRAGIAEPEIVEVDGGFGYRAADSSPATEGEADTAGDTSAPVEAYGDESLDLRRRQDMGSSLERELTDDDIASQPLSKIWPKQEVDAIEDTDAAAFATAVRDSIPAKPRKSSRKARWVEEVKAAREVMRHYQNNPEKVLELAKGSRALRGMLDRVEVLKSLDRSEWSRVGSVRTHPTAHTYSKSGEKVPAPQVSVEIDGRGHTVRGAKTAAEAIDFIKEKLASSDPKATSGMKFTVRGRPGRYFIHKDGDSERRPLATFDTTEAAFDYRKNNYDDLVKAWDEVKERDNVKKTDVRSKENRARTGADYRQGRDISPQEFVEQFGLRHVDFGKWVKDGDGERQRLLNQTYDALMDLSNIVGIPPSAIGLEGNLIFTFGKRGSGSASAHFEAGTNKVINLTKTKGAGSLGHEWFHALDNYFQEKRGPHGADRENAFITYAPENFYRDKKTGQRIPEREFDVMAEGGVSERGRRFVMSRFDRDNWELVEGVRPEVAIKFAELVEALDKSPMKGRSSVIDKGRSDGYWSRVLERAARSFENYLIAKMEENGYNNDFLANVVSPDRFARNPERYPYLLPEETAPVSDAFDSLFETIESDSDSGMLYSREAYVPADAKPKGVGKGTAQLAVNKFLKQYKGADDVNVVVARNYEEHFGQKAEFRTKGGYDPKTDTLYLFTEELDSVADLGETLRHEILVHKGLGMVEPAQLKQLLDIFYASAKDSPELAQIVDEVERVEKGRSDRVKAEEILARIGQETLSLPNKVLNKLMLAIQRMLNSIGLGKVSARRQGKDLVYRIADAFAEGKRARRRVDLDGVMQSRTQGWDGFPDAIIAHKSVSDHPDYSAAKSGDMDAAIRLAEDRVTDEYIQRISEVAGEGSASLAPVLAVEAGGRNRIPLAVAEVIADRLGLDVETDIVQLDRVERGGKDGFYRIANPPEFGGKVRDGDYILVDDTLAQGGTLAQLKEHIETNGGKVILATALTGKQYSSKIALEKHMLEMVRSEYGELEPWFENEFGYDFSGLTQSEARYIVKSGASPDALRNRIIAARNGNGSPESEGLFRSEEEVTPPSLFSRSDDTFTPPVEERMASRWVRNRDWFIRKFQNKFIPVQRLEEAIKESGGNVSERDSVVMAEEAFYGKTENDLKTLEKRLVDPLIAAMSENDVSQEELDLFLIANHAKERNAYIASINDDLPDGGSGMTDAESDAVMRRFREEGKLDAVKTVAEKVYKITETRRRILEDAGLVDADYLAQFETPYENYVPLKGFAENESEGRAKVGRGFDIRGKEDIRAMGRRTMAESPTLHAIQDLTASAIRLRKNEVGQTFLRMVEANPNPEYWEVFTEDNPDTRRTMVNGRVKEQPISNMGMLKDDYYAVKRDGKEYFIKVKDKRVQDALQNVGPEQLGAFVRAAGKVTRFLSAVNTSYNPEFMISNMSRDIQTAVYNALAENELEDGKIKGAGKSLSARMVKGVPKAMRAIWGESRGKEGDSEYRRYYKEFLADGAKTGYFDSKDIDGLAKELQNKLSMAKGTPVGMAKRGIKAVGDFVEDMNSAVENAVRLSGYIEARKAGVSRKKAASFAKAMTINFNAKGEAGSAMNAAFLFFNAAIQGNKNFLRAIGHLADSEQGRALSNAYTGKKLNAAQKAAGVMMGAGIALSLLNREMAGEDDDGENWYDKVPDYVRERNIVLMKSLFGGPEGEYYTIPLPYGYNIFYNLGDAIEGSFNGSKKRKEGLGLNLALSAINSFSPFGYHGGENAAEQIGLTFTPTIAQPLVEIIANTNHFGGDIYRENYAFGPQKADAELSFRSTKQIYKNVAEFMNRVSGGSTYESGAIDVSPDTLEHIAEFALGGIYRLGDRTLESIDATVDGRELDVGNIPFRRKVEGEVTPYDDISRFYDARQEIVNLREEMKLRRGRERVEFLKDNRLKLQLKGMVDSTYERLRDLNKRRDRIEENESLTDAQRDERLRAIERMKKKAVDRFNKRWNEAA